MSTCATSYEPNYRYDEGQMLRSITKFNEEKRTALAARAAAEKAETEIRVQDFAERHPEVPKAAMVPVSPDWRNIPTFTSRHPIFDVGKLPKWAGACIIAASACFGMEPAEITLICNEKKYVVPRRIAMYLMVRVVGVSLSQAGRCLGGMHHTTVLTGVRVIERQRLADPALNSRMDRAESEVRLRLGISTGSNYHSC
jgi:hypothetical protein